MAEPQNLHDYENWSTPSIVCSIHALRAMLQSEEDELIREHYAYQLDAAREELRKRNAAVRAKRLS